MPTKPKVKALTTYTWQGTNKQGNSVKGEMNGTSIALVRADLRRQGLNPTKIRKKPKPLFGSSAQKIKGRDIAIFSRQLATMTAAGLPLLQSFEIVGRGLTNTTMSDIIMSIKNDVETGTSLADAFGKHPRYFNDLFCNLIGAGEQSGTLDEMLSRVATYREKSESLKGKIKKALFYPTTVLLVAFIVTIALLVFVVPQFEAVFKSFGADLPVMTQAVVKLSRFFQSYWWLFFGFVSGGVWLLLKMKRTSKKFAFQFDKTLLRLPVIGEILRKAAIASFCRTLSTTFAAGLPLVDALKCVAGATGNLVYSEATHQIREEVATGQQIQVSMRATQLFPNMVLQMVAIGEESGSLEEMLAKVAEFYEEEVDNAVDNLSSLLEPLIMVILGVIIGTLIVAMYLPIFKLGSII